MSNECSPSVGSIGWNELVTTDTSASADFYGKLFGWSAVRFTPEGSPAGSPEYFLFKTDAAANGVAGMVKPMHPDAPTHWMPYVVVDDVEAALAKANILGAVTIVPVMSIGEMGRIAVIKDPKGAIIGLHDSLKK